MKQILRDLIEFSVSHCLWSLGVPERGYLQALSRIQSKVAALQSIIREQMQSNQICLLDHQYELYYWHC